MVFDFPDVPWTAMICQAASGLLRKWKNEIRTSGQYQASQFNSGWLASRVVPGTSGNAAMVSTKTAPTLLENMFSRVSSWAEFWDLSWLRVVRDPSFSRLSQHRLRRRATNQ
ncbi:hypothetical protein K438DRAFT_1779922 [Mycena galopus ATCC 62051]|nr:hypothetical protein K438DRAFT_1779922 [Mycena galopus ATCC 62051]